MSIKLMYILFFGAALFLIFVITMIRKKYIDFKYALTWMLTSIIFILISVFPGSIFLISNLVGIKTPVNTLFVILIIFLINIIFTLSIAVSQSFNKIKILTQEIGIMKFKIENLEKTNN